MGSACWIIGGMVVVGGVVLFAIAASRGGASAAEKCARGHDVLTCSYCGAKGCVVGGASACAERVFDAQTQTCMKCGRKMF